MGGRTSKVNDKESYNVALQKDPKTGVAKVEISPNASLAQLSGELVRIRDVEGCLLYTSPSPRDATLSRMPSSA